MSIAADACRSFTSIYIASIAPSSTRSASIRISPRTGVTAVEWAERLTRSIPNAVVVRILDQGEDLRSIEITPDS